MHASADKVLAALRGRATDTAPIPLGDGDVTAVALQLGDQRVLGVAFDYGARHGSIGIQEADQLVRAFQFARSERLPIALLLETSGIRVTDGTAGIASLRRVLREAEDARLDGLPMLGVVLRCAFGGASILAALCERRMIHPDSLYGMSGPRLIGAAAGAATFDAADPAAVRSVLGGGARAPARRVRARRPRCRRGERGCRGLVAIDPRRTGDRRRPRPCWGRARPPPCRQSAYRDAAGRGARRRADQRRPRARCCREPGSSGGCRTSRSLSPTRARTPGCSCSRRRTGAGARHALALSEALLEPSPPGRAPRRTVILVDTPGHRGDAGRGARRALRLPRPPRPHGPPRAPRRRHRGRHRHGPRRRGHPGCARQRRHLRRDGTGRAVAGASSRRAPRAGQGAATTTKGGSTRPCTPARWTPLSPLAA